MCVLSQCTHSHIEPVTPSPWKVRPRTSAWYSLYVEATRRNPISPDLPGTILCSYIVVKECQRIFHIGEDDWSKLADTYYVVCHMHRTKISSALDMRHSLRTLQYQVQVCIWEYWTDQPRRHMGILWIRFLREEPAMPGMNMTYSECVCLQVNCTCTTACSDMTETNLSCWGGEDDWSKLACVRLASQNESWVKRQYDKREWKPHRRSTGTCMHTW